MMLTTDALRNLLHSLNQLCSIVYNPTVPKIAQLNVKGRIFDHPKDAEKVNDFFVNIGMDTEMEIPKVPNL